MTDKQIIEPDTLKKLIEAVKKREDWIHSLPQKGDSEFAHYFMGFNFLDKIVVFAEYYDRHTNITQWYIWENDELRNATRFEDFVFSAIHNDGLRDEFDESEMFTIISRDANNKVEEGDEE